jgi:hypothetical protein
MGYYWPTQSVTSHLYIDKSQITVFFYWW